jgi:PKHD-type hydroxylase
LSTLLRLTSKCIASHVFSEIEVDQIIELGQRSTGTEWWNGVKDPLSRSAWSGTIQNSEENSWIFERLTRVFDDANQHYRFDLDLVDDKLLFVRYDEGDHFEWHIDLGEGVEAHRKLSISVQLSSPSEYAGGELQFMYEHSPQPVGGIGDGVVFPSYLPHRVCKVESGQRYALVGWIHGQPFS